MSNENEDTKKVDEAAAALEAKTEQGNDEEGKKVEPGSEESGTASAEEAAELEEEKAFEAEMAGESQEVDAKVPTGDEEAKPKGEVDSDDKGKKTGDQEDELKVERVEIFAGYTEEEVVKRFALLDKLEKRIDTTNGTFGARLEENKGDMAKLLEELKGLKGKGGKLDTKSLTLKRLSEEYPEMAKLLTEDLQSLTDQGSTDEKGKADDNQKESDAVKELRNELDGDRKIREARELRSLTRAHPDWKELAMFTVGADNLAYFKDQGFGSFVSQLPAEEQQIILNAYDAEFIGEKLTEYKSELKAKAEKEKAEADKKNKKKVPNAADSLPSGTGSQHDPSDEDEEEAAFRKEMAS